jgi:glycosyltransferase involved in cell wall biosynthesis
MISANNPLLFVGISSMRTDASQHKLYFLADLLGRSGTPVSVLVPDLAENRGFFADKPHVTAHFYPSGSALADFGRKSRFVRSGRWSAIWVVGVGVRSCLQRGSVAAGVPLIQDFDEFPSMIASFGPLRRAYLRWMERRAIARADGFTCASAGVEKIVRRLRQDIGNRALRLPVAISAGEHATDPGLVSRLRQDAAGRPVLLYVGTISRFYESQIDELVALSEILRRQGSPALLKIAGEGEDLEYFKEKALRPGSGNLEFIGHVRREELASHMEAARVLLFPFPATPFNLSRCPTKVFHYAAANRPVVTNRIGEVAELLDNTAFYYRSGDVEDMARACHRALGAGPEFSNGIEFDALTWERRATTFVRWLGDRGWLEANHPSPVQCA